MSARLQIITYAVVFGGLAVTAVHFWFVRRRLRSRRVDASEQETPDGSTSAAHQLPGPRQDDEQSTSHFDTSTLACLAAAMPDEKLREFLDDITKLIDEAGPVFNSETSLGIVEELVDRWDDLGSVREKQPEPVAKDIEAFRNLLKEILSRCGVELLHSEIWAPSTQRAISKEPRPGIATPSIHRFGSTGIRRNGQLIRKQEVLLSVPEF